MNVEYALSTRTCDEIDAYYEEAALQAGWKLYKHESTDLDMTWSYAKVEQGYQLTFDLYCVQPAGSLYSDHYDVSMDVPFPYNISFVGGLVAHGIINPYGDARP